MLRKSNSIYGDPFLSDEEMFLQKLSQKADALTGRRSKPGQASEGMPAPKGADAIRNQLKDAGIGTEQLQNLVRNKAISMDEYNYITRAQGQRELADLRGKGLLEGALANGTVDPKKIEKIQQFESRGYYGKNVGNKQLTNAGITNEDAGYLNQLLNKRQMQQQAASQAGQYAPVQMGGAPDPYADVTSSAIASRMQQAGIENPNVSDSGMIAAKQDRMMDVLGKYKGSAPGSVNIDAVKKEAFGPAGQMINGRPAGAKGHDPEVMKDGVSYAIMLKGMDPAVIPQVWPRIANDLISRDPTLQGIINPNVPPTPETLDSLLATAGLGPATGQVARDASGNVAKDQPQGIDIMQPGMNTGSLAQSEAQKQVTKDAMKEINDADETLSSLRRMSEQFDPAMVGAAGAYSSAQLSARDYLSNLPGGSMVGISKEDADWLQQRAGFVTTIKDLSMSYIKQKSGLQYSDQQLDFINKIIPRESDSPNVFQGKLKSLTTNLEKLKDLKVNLMQAGLKPGSNQYKESFLAGARSIVAGGGVSGMQGTGADPKRTWVQKTLQANPQYANDPEFIQHLSTEYDKKYGGR